MTLFGTIWEPIVGIQWCFTKAPDKGMIPKGAIILIQVHKQVATWVIRRQCAREKTKRRGLCKISSQWKG